MRNIALRSILLAVFMLAISAATFGQVSITVAFGPPALPVYVQPVCPAEGYIWTPGYWAWDADADDYYWVPGTWVLAPEPGFLWTPPWWGWEGGYYVFHHGYWGPHVGFYGGINYGFGYFGHGFEGGRWEHDHFYYNRSVTNVNVSVIHNTYERRVVVEHESRVSYNGGEGGIRERPNREEEEAGRERHVGPVGDQVRHRDEARGDRELRASVNRGKPAIAATPRPGGFKEQGVAGAREAGAPYNPPARGGAPRPTSVVHPRDLPTFQRPPAPNTGNPKLDQKYQQQQENLYRKQDQERQNLQRKQEQEHQRYTQQKANDARTQQLEQKHQQQTQHLEEKHTQQQQKLQNKQAPNDHHR